MQSVFPKGELHILDSYSLLVITKLSGLFIQWQPCSLLMFPLAPCLENGRKKLNTVGRTPFSFLKIIYPGMLLNLTNSVNWFKLAILSLSCLVWSYTIFLGEDHYSGLALGWILVASFYDMEKILLHYDASLVQLPPLIVLVYELNILNTFFSKKFGYEEIVILIMIIEIQGRSYYAHST